MLFASLKLTGRVQGVFCRKFIKEKASGLGISGKAWNEKDGSVRIDCECQGEGMLEKFILALTSKNRPFIYSAIRIGGLEILEKRNSEKQEFSSFETA